MSESLYKQLGPSQGFVSLYDELRISKDHKPNQEIELSRFANLTKNSIKALIDSGVQINPSCRLFQYPKLIDNDNTYDRIRLGEMLLEMSQWSSISKTFNELDGSSSEWKSKLKIASGGVILQSDSRIPCASRNFQFELFLATCMKSAGWKVEPREPDIFLKINERPFTIAAKRLHSVKKLYRNLSKGVSQIDRAALPGVVAIDLSFLEHVSKPVWIKQINHVHVFAAILVRAFAEEHRRELLSIASNDLFKGVLLYCSTPVSTLEPLTLAISRSWLFVSDKPNSECNTLVRRLGSLN